MNKRIIAVICVFATVVTTLGYTVWNKGNSDTAVVFNDEVENASLVANNRTLPWGPLATLDSNADLRDGMDEIFQITPYNETGKNGVLYVSSEDNTHDDNNTFVDTLRNKFFNENYATNEKVITQVKELALASTGTASTESAYLSYWDLLGYGDTQVDITKDLSRADAYALIYRAYNGYDNVNATPTLADYVTWTGNKAFINVSNSLGGEFDNTISKAEAFYLITQSTPELANLYASEVYGFEYEDIKDGGSIVEFNKFTNSDGTPIAGWESQFLNYALTKNKAKTNLPSELYKSFEVMTAIDYLEEGSTTDWNKPINAGELVTMIRDINKAVNEKFGYLSEVDYGAQSVSDIEFEAKKTAEQYKADKAFYSSLYDKGELTLAINSGLIDEDEQSWIDWVQENQYEVGDDVPDAPPEVVVADEEDTEVVVTPAPAPEKTTDTSSGSKGGSTGSGSKGGSTGSGSTGNTSTTPSKPSTSSGNKATTEEAAAIFGGNANQSGASNTSGVGDVNESAGIGWGVN